MSAAIGGTLGNLAAQSLAQLQSNTPAPSGRLATVAGNLGRAFGAFAFEAGLGAVSEFLGGLSGSLAGMHTGNGVGRVFGLVPGTDLSGFLDKALGSHLKCSLRHSR